MNDLKITADYREKSSGLIDLLKNRGVVVELKSIPCGDYIIDDTITIERKTANDFLISIINGRLFRQLLNLKKFCTNPILLIEPKLCNCRGCWRYKTSGVKLYYNTAIT